MFDQSIIIDNCIVSKDGNGIRITPIKLARKLYPTLNINILQKITFGNKFNDNTVINRLAMGTMTFNQLFV